MSRRCDHLGLCQLSPECAQHEECLAVSRSAALRELPTVRLGDEEADRQQWQRFIRDAFLLLIGVALGAATIVTGIVVAISRA